MKIFVLWLCIVQSKCSSAWKPPKQQVHNRQVYSRGDCGQESSTQGDDQEALAREPLVTGIEPIDEYRDYRKPQDGNEDKSYSASQLVRAGLDSRYLSTHT